jgi:hypothetical protein
MNLIFWEQVARQRPNVLGMVWLPANLTQKGEIACRVGGQTCIMWSASVSTSNTFLVGKGAA